MQDEPTVELRIKLAPQLVFDYYVSEAVGSGLSKFIARISATTLQVGNESRSTTIELFAMMYMSVHLHLPIFEHILDISNI